MIYFKKIFIFSIILLSIIFNSSVYAISPEQRFEIERYPFYDSKAGECEDITSQAADYSTPNSVNLPESLIEGVNKLKDLYVKVGKEKKVPWQALAAVDYRESNNNPERSALAGEKLGTRNPDHPERTMNTKEESLLVAADYLTSLARGVYKVDVNENTDPEQMKSAFLAYNRGYIYQRKNIPPEKSPYVMNNLDEAHKDMVWPAGDPLSGRKEVGRFGAWVVYTRLGGLNSGSGCTISESSGDIVEIARKELDAGVKEEPPGSNKSPRILEYTDGNAERWCADFVSWVYKQAGKPFTGGSSGGWRIAGALAVGRWFESNKLWINRGDSDPQPGDVIVFNHGHVGLVEKVDGNTIETIEGNSSDKISRRTYTNYKNYSDIKGFGRWK